MTAAAARKLQKDIDVVLKKVEDGLDEFQTTWDFAASCSSGPQKDKYGEELKKSINKLQRLRAQIREWLGQGEVKSVCKDKLEESRKRIEEDMQRFKDFERDLKTKAFSTSALAKETELDLEEVEKMQYQDWLNNTLQVLNDQQDEFDADLEALGNKKSLSIDEKYRQTSLRSLQERHRWHTHKLELLLRALDNDSIDLSEIAILRESVDVFIEMHQDPDYVHDEGLYDCFDLAEYEEKTPVVRNSGGSEVKDGKEGNTGSSKEEPAKKGKEKEKQKKNDKKDKKREEREKKGAAGAAGTPGGTPAGASTKVGSNAGSRQGGDGKSTPSGAGPGSPAQVPDKEKRLLDDFNLDEVKVQEDQLLSEAEEFICKICQIHVVGCSPKLTNCSHLFCGDCIAQWFSQHPESQTWAQRARSAGPERVVPCPVCKQPLNEKKDLYPVCGATSRSENLLLWRMLSSLKIMCVNHSKLRSDGKCEWIGEYGQYQKHALSCRNGEGGDTTPAAATTPQPVRKLDAGDGDTPSDKSLGVGVAAAVAHAAAAAATPPRTPPAPTAAPTAAVPEQRSPGGGGGGVRPPVTPAPVMVPAPKAPTTPTPHEVSSTAGQAPGKTTRPVAEQPPKSGLSPQAPVFDLRPLAGAAPASAPSLPAAPPAAAPTLPQSPAGMAPKSSPPQAAPVVTAPASPAPAAAPVVALAPAFVAQQPTETKAAAPESDSSFIVQATAVFEPTAPSMLHIQVGDFVQVLERHASGWSYCRSMANNTAGWAPNWAVTPPQSDEATSNPAPAPKAAPAPTTAPAPVVQEAAPKEQVLRPAPLAPAPAAMPVATAASAQRPRPAAPPAAPKAPKSVVRAASATFTAVGPAQLSVAVNDLVEIIERHGSGWTYGRKVGGAENTPEGWFPDWVCGTK